MRDLVFLSSYWSGPFHYIKKIISFRQAKFDSGGEANKHLFPLPLLIKEKLVEVIGNNSGGEGPRSTVPRPISVAPSQSMCTTESNNFPIIKAHSVEDVPQVSCTLGSIGKTSVGCAGCNISVDTSRAVGDDWSLHLLDSANPSEDPEIRVGNPWMLLCKAGNKGLAGSQNSEGRDFNFLYSMG